MADYQCRYCEDEWFVETSNGRKPCRECWSRCGECTRDECCERHKSVTSRDQQKLAAEVRYLRLQPGPWWL